VLHCNHEGHEEHEEKSRIKKKKDNHEFISLDVYYLMGEHEEKTMKNTESPILSIVLPADSSCDIHTMYLELYLKPPCPCIIG